MIQPMRLRAGTTRAAWLALLAVLLLAPTPAHAGLTEAEFKKAASAAGKLMKKRGEAVDKKGVIAVLATDDTPRALAVLVEWAEISAALRKKRLEPEAGKRREQYRGYLEKVLQKHDGSEAGWSDAERGRLAKRRAAWKEALALVVTETNVLTDIAAAIAASKGEGAVAWLAHAGVPALMKGEGLEPLLEASVQALLKHPAALAGDAVVRAVARPFTPKVRIQALDWIALEMIEGAAMRITPCLLSRSVPVRRAAVRALRALDEPRSVPPLIESLESATGLLAAEIERVLHHFTGESFSRDGAAWKRWWQEKGAAWLKFEDGRRHTSKGTGGDFDFYGIASPSNRIVFLLDRSGSMEHPAQTQGKAPVTGGDKKKHAAGQTKLQVAKAELRRAINRLGVDAKFNVLFYNHKVDAWKAPPNLVDASRENKTAARTWFMAQKPVGSTELFAGLMRALKYSSTLDREPEDADAGADTVFLLSDGAPTTGVPPRLMTEEETEAAVLAFLAANKLARLVVHTIGVGPQHNKELMKRLAAQTGGTYVAVGMD